MRIKCTCHVLLARTRSALGIRLFYGSQTCSPNHLCSECSACQSLVESGAGLEGRSLVPTSALLAGVVLGQVFFQALPTPISQSSNCSVAWATTILTWTCPLSPPPFSGCQRKRTWNGTWKHLPEAKINSSVAQNFALFFSFRLSGFSGVCAYLYGPRCSFDIFLFRSEEILN